MCDPISIISAAATIGGGLLQQSAANKAVKEQAEVTALERQRQRKIQEQQEGLFQESLRKSDRGSTEEEMAAAEDERKQLYSNLIQEEAPSNTIGQELDTVVNNRVVQDEIGRRKGLARENSLNMAGLRAALDSFGDATFNQGIDRNRTNQKMGMYGNFGQGSSAVVPAELQAASQAGAGRALLGQILGTAGQVGMFAGGAGMDNIRNIFGKSTVGGAAKGGINFNAVPSGGPGIRLPMFG